jgi:hypothetical protein
MPLHFGPNGLVKNKFVYYICEKSMVKTFYSFVHFKIVPLVTELSKLQLKIRITYFTKKAKTWSKKDLI